MQEKEKTMKANLKKIITCVCVASVLAAASFASYTRYDWNGGGWSGSWVSSGTWEGDIYFSGGEVVQNNLVRMKNLP